LRLCTENLVRFDLMTEPLNVGRGRADFLPLEPGRLVLQAQEYQEIVGDRMFRTRRLDRMRRRASAALVNAQHELAFRKRRMRDEGKDPELDGLVAGWRNEIQRLRTSV